MTKCRTVAFHTLGCKVNRYETDAVMQSFIAAGYVVLDFDSVCDVYVINTCTVTGEAARKSGQFIRRARRRNPESTIVAMGCQIQISGGSGQADILIGTTDKMKALELVEQYLAGKENPHFGQRSKLHDVSGISEYEEIGPVRSFEGSRAYVKIEDGCNRFCSYCIIPYARGRVRSRSQKDILSEINGLAEDGFREVVITGIDLSAYGSDRGEDMNSLADLIEQTGHIEGIKRIRLGSLEPYSLSRDLIIRLSRSPKLCPHFHLSLQSGSDTVLGRMNREYDTRYFRELISDIREYFEDVMITADIITGFPGETDEEHEQTMAFCREMDFLDMHIFKYSKREGTRAASMRGHVAADIMNERSRQLLVLADSMKCDNLKRVQIRQEKSFAVLVETVGDDHAQGYTENYIPAVIIPDDGSGINNLRIGDIYTVRAVFEKNGSLYMKF